MIKKVLPPFEGLGEAAAPPSLTCREIRSTSHSSSHSWATADMATTVDTRMTTSPICKGEEPPDGVRAGVAGQPEGPQHV